MNPWIEAMRLRTLPVSIAGVLCGTGCAVFYHSFQWIPAICCLLFALGAQIASNFANEYFDYRNGFDRKGRDGFRRGVTEGDIAPQAMLRATIFTLAAACIPGLVLIYYGGWWMIAVGVVVAIFALAYSAGPYPLSHHGLGDLAVIIFFGLVPVILTAWLQNPSHNSLPLSICTGLGVGLLAANVLIVNNYRDVEDDTAVGKHTTVVIFGKRIMRVIYLFFGIEGVVLLCTPVFLFNPIICAMPLILIPAYVTLYFRLKKLSGKSLNTVLKHTALVLLFGAVYFVIEAILCGYVLPPYYTLD